MVLRVRYALAAVAALQGCSAALDFDAVSRDWQADAGQDAATPNPPDAGPDAAAVDASQPGPDMGDDAGPTDRDAGQDGGLPVPPPPLDPPVGNIVGYADRCVEVTAGVLQLADCRDAAEQRWTVGFDDTLRALDLCLDGVPAPEGNAYRPHMATCDGSPGQRWFALGGALFNEAAHACLDVKDLVMDSGTPLQTWGCSGNANQQWRVPVLPSSGPDFGPQVVIFDPRMSREAVQRRLDAVFAQQESNEFGQQRFALLFKPGDYEADVNVGFYVQVAGLGLLPDAVHITGEVHVEGDWWPHPEVNRNNSTHNFWRLAENLSVTPSLGTNRWAVSQAAPLRRVHVRGTNNQLRLDDPPGYASGGFMADSLIDEKVVSGAQQQWLSRNSEWASWEGGAWNMVFVGDVRAPASLFPDPPYTVVDRTPVIREKPFLIVDVTGHYRVFVPPVRRNVSGTSWSGADPMAGAELLDIEQFAIVTPKDAASTINAALDAGKHLLVTPGRYRLDEPLRITHPDTVVLGLGLPSLIPANGGMALSVTDVPGVKIAGLIIDAGGANSALLMQVGEPSANLDHEQNPTSLHDLYVRVGGMELGRATTSLEINSPHVIGDNLWLWRADHGARPEDVGWTVNTGDTGLVVNGHDVTMYGLFVEHYQKYQTIWNGNAGRTYFYMNEMPYDVPDQASWMNGAGLGYAAYKVADTVTQHHAWGLGSYCFFDRNPAVVVDRAFETPTVSGVVLQNMVTVSIEGKGTISHLHNDQGEPAQGNSMLQTSIVTLPP